MHAQAWGPATIPEGHPLNGQSTPSAALFRKLAAQFEICVCALKVEKESLQDAFHQYLMRQMLT
jgi:hypothetical protein